MDDKNHWNMSSESNSSYILPIELRRALFCLPKS